VDQEHAMDKPKNSIGVTAAATLTVVLLVVALVGLIAIYSGAYNIAATEQHTSFVRWVFDTTFHSSIRTRANEVTPPVATSVEAGASEYKAMCQHCHGGPDIDPDEWSRGMRPQPPMLTDAAAEWELKEVFWLVKHGAKMTGMPAFGPSHDDQTLWNIAAFVKDLPAMSRERYELLADESHVSAATSPPGAMP
jgi:mono/diheme cytochrome c family protein